MDKDINEPLTITEKEPYWYHPLNDSGDLDDFIFDGEYIKPYSEK